MKYEYETMEEYEKKQKKSIKLCALNFFLFTIMEGCFILFSNILKEFIFVFGILSPILISVLWLSIYSDETNELNIEKERRCKRK